MPREAQLALLLIMFAWGTWYFSKMIWIGLKSGKLIDSEPWDGAPVTRSCKPVIFWFSIAGAAVFVFGFMVCLVVVSGDLLGIWRSEF